MDFGLGADLELLRRTAREFMTSHTTADLIRRMRDDPRGYDPAQWREAEALGWADLADLEEPGTHLAMVVLAIECGRSLWPSPLLERLAKGRADVGTLLSAAKLVGIADTALELTLAHVTTRQQFGHPIGSFQAARHRLADMSAENDVARVLAYHAAWTIECRAGAAVTIARAKLAACRAAQAAIAGSHQLHGGVGFAADHVLPLYTVAALRAEFDHGDAERQLDRLAETLGDE